MSDYKCTTEFIVNLGSFNMDATVTQAGQITCSKAGTVDHLTKSILFVKDIKIVTRFISPQK